MKRSALTPSLMVPSVAEAVAFYVEQLSFEQTAGWEDKGELVWAEVSRGEARIWFYRDAMRPDEAPQFSGFFYLFVDDVDGEAEALKPHVKTIWGPEDMAYGLREFGFEDLNGYRLVLARDIETSEG